jgi:hypothetical protein
LHEAQAKERFDEGRRLRHPADAGNASN